MLQVSGVAGMVVSSLSGAASHPCKGGHVAVHLPTGFKGDPRDSISSMAFGRKVSLHGFPLQLFLPLVDSGEGLLNIMVWTGTGEVSCLSTVVSDHVSVLRRITC